MNSASHVTTIWPAPKSLNLALPPVETFDLTMLPSAMRDWVRDIQRSLAVPLDFCGVLSMILLAGAVNRRARVQPKQRDSNWREPCNLWCALVGKPGVRKTPVMNRMLKPLRNVEQRLEQRNRERIAEWIKEKKQAKEDGKDAPIKPPVQRMLAADATTEALLVLCRDNPAGLAVVRDELTGWLADMMKEGRQGERAFWLLGWSGDVPHTQDRIGRGTTSAPAVCLTLVGGVQPARLASYIDGSDGNVPLGDDGLLQRFGLAVFPDRVAYEYIDEEPNEQAEQKVQRIVDLLSAVDVEQPILLKFSGLAQKLFKQWMVENESKLRADDLNPLVAEFLSKYPSLMAELAALLELADRVAQLPMTRKLIGSFDGVLVQALGKSVIEISHGNVQKAICWCKYLESHARRICHFANPARSVSAKLARKVVNGDLTDGFTLRDVQRPQWQGLKTNEAVKSALSQLVGAGWLRESPTKPGPKGGRPSVPYQINPALKSMTEQSIEDLIYG